MRIEWCDKDQPIDVEMGGEELRVVKANRDGTYQILVFNGAQYVLFTRAEIKAFKGYADDEDAIYKATTKEIWDSWCRRSRRLQIWRETYESDQRPRR